MFRMVESQKTDMASITQKAMLTRVYTPQNLVILSGGLYRYKYPKCSTTTFIFIIHKAPIKYVIAVERLRFGRSFYAVL